MYTIDKSRRLGLHWAALEGVALAVLIKRVGWTWKQVKPWIVSPYVTLPSLGFSSIVYAFAKPQESEATAYTFSLLSVGMCLPLAYDAFRGMAAPVSGYKWAIPFEIGLYSGVVIGHFYRVWWDKEAK